MATTLTLSLVSHTNVGKTTLARTLLGEDVGEVRDAAHVTDSVDTWTLLRSPDGDALQLADTPGFGDSVRLLARLRGRSNPIGWLLAEVWDRWRDRPFWASQQALAQVKAHTDIVLYLVNASESPAAAGYIEPEMALLGWTGKPVVVLLNQLGTPRDAAAELADVARWQRQFGGHTVLALDAFARCWVQEGVLWRALRDVLADDAERAAMQRLIDAWQAQQGVRLDAAMALLAQALAGAALRSEPLAGSGGVSLRERVGATLGLGKAGDGAAQQAQQALAKDLGQRLQIATSQLIRLHRLQGDAERAIVERVAGAFQLRERVDEGRAALWGGAVTGALAGLKADIATGGLTLGGGLLAGAVIGALGAAGIARGVNVVRGSERSWVTWSAGALHEATQTALLTYLAVAHFGRGRGAWSQGDAPAHWRAAIDGALAARRGALDALWAARPAPGARAETRAREDTDARDDDVAAGGAASARAETLARELAPLLRASAEAALRALYPQAWSAGTENGSGGGSPGFGADNRSAWVAAGDTAPWPPASAGGAQPPPGAA